MTNIEGYQAEDADLTITIDRADLEQTMMGRKTLMAQIAGRNRKDPGRQGVLAKLASTLVQFTPDFEILPGTKRPDGPPDLTDYEVGPVELRGE